MPIYRRHISKRLYPNHILHTQLGHMLVLDSKCTLCGKRYGRLFVLEEHSDPTYLKGIPNLFCWGCLNTHEWHWISTTPQEELFTAVNYQWTKSLQVYYQSRLAGEDAIFPKPRRFYDQYIIDRNEALKRYQQ